MKRALLLITLCSTFFMAWVLFVLGEPSLCIRSRFVDTLVLSSKTQSQWVDRCSVGAKLLRKVFSSRVDQGARKVAREYTRRLNLLQTLEPYMKSSKARLKVIVTSQMRQNYRLEDGYVFIQSEYAQRRGALESVVLYHWLQKQFPSQKELKAKAAFLASVLVGQQTVNVFNKVIQKKASDLTIQYRKSGAFGQIDKVRKVFTSY